MGDIDMILKRNKMFPICSLCCLRDEGQERVCYDTTSPELFDDFLVYSSAVSVLMFALPFMVVMVCYGLMVRKLLEPGWSAGAPGGGADGETGGRAAVRSKQKSVKMIIIVLAAFMLCFLPFHLTRSLYYSFRYLRQVNPAQVSNTHTLCFSRTSTRRIIWCIRWKMIPGLTRHVDLRQVDLGPVRTSHIQTNQLTELA